MSLYVDQRGGGHRCPEKVGLVAPSWILLISWVELIYCTNRTPRMGLRGLPTLVSYQVCGTPQEQNGDELQPFRQHLSPEPGGANRGDHAGEWPKEPASGRPIWLHWLPKMGGNLLQILGQKSNPHAHQRISRKKPRCRFLECQLSSVTCFPINKSIGASHSESSPSTCFFFFLSVGPFFVIKRNPQRA